MQRLGDSLAQLIEALGHPARVAYDGAHAFEEFVAFEPDVAILDVQMPHMDGCAAAARMRAYEHPLELIASLTGMPLDEEPMRSQSGVFDEHLSKPCEVAKLGDLLGRCQAAIDAKKRR